MGTKTDYVAIASRRGEGRGYQLMLKTGYVEIAPRPVTVARSCFTIEFITKGPNMKFFIAGILLLKGSLYRGFSV
jgi:hypothetical protein